MECDDIFLRCRIGSTLQHIKMSTNFIPWFDHHHCSKTVVWNLWYDPTSHQIYSLNSNRNTMKTTTITNNHLHEKFIVNGDRSLFQGTAQDFQQVQSTGQWFQQPVVPVIYYNIPISTYARGVTYIFFYRGEALLFQGPPQDFQQVQNYISIFQGGLAALVIN